MQRVRDDAMVDERLDSLERRMDTFESAFPGKDADGHRRFHELMIEQLAERRKLRQAIVEKSVAGLVWAGVVAVAIAAWQYVKTAIRAG